MLGIFKKKLPKKVLLLSALPDNEEIFMSFAKAEKSDFLRSLRRLYEVNDDVDLWNAYASSAKALQLTYKVVESRGGKVVHNFTIQDVGHINEYDIVIVIAHHSDNSDEIEIGGEMVRTMDFVKAIPNGTQVVLDLTSCYSAYMIPQIKGHVPMSKIIGIEVKTGLAFRLFLLEKVLEHLSKNTEKSYLEALKFVLASLPKSKGEIHVKDATPEVHLGGKLQSTVYAPKEVKKGDDFIVSVFLHKDDDADEVEIIAKSVDDAAEKKNAKRISAKLRNGDKVEFQLSMSKQYSDFFKVDKCKKGFLWDGGINNVEFIVSVSSECSVSSFIGNVKVCVNKEPVGDMVFKTTIVSSRIVLDSGCADFDFIPFDKQAEMQKANSSLLSQLSNRIILLNSQLRESRNGTDGKLFEELEMCKKCKELLEDPIKNTTNRVFKVFISSTSDMKKYRQVVKERVEACEMYPDMYENWGQGNDYPRDMCCKHVLQSDIFVCILGAKYGFVEPIWDKSMTEIEYRIAQKAGLPILIYVMANYKEEMEKLADEEKQWAIRQEQLIDEMKNKRMIGIFPNELGLSLLVNSELLTIKHKLQL